MAKSKAGQNARRVLERLRSNEPSATLAAALSLKDSDIHAARDLVRHLGEHQAAAVGRLPSILAQALVEAAVQIEHAGFLKAVAEQGSKGAASAAKRGLAILRSKGIEVDIAPKGDAVFKPEPARTDEMPCFLSTSDSAGERALWIPRAIRGGVQLVTALLSDVKGILQVATDEVSRKSFKRLRDELLDRTKPAGVTLFEISPARARGYLAAVRALSQGLTIDFELQLTGLLGGDPKDALSPVSAEPPLPNDLEAQRLAESAELHEEREVRGWLPDPDIMQALALKLDEIATSALSIDDAQRRARFAAELERSMETHFDTPCRARYAQRLFELCEVFRTRGEMAPAERAAATARALVRGRPPQTIPFCRALFDKVLVLADEEAGPEPSDLIVPP